MTATALRGGWEQGSNDKGHPLESCRVRQNAIARKDAYLGQTRAAVQNPSPDDPTKKRQTFLEWLFGR